MRNLSAFFSDSRCCLLFPQIIFCYFLGFSQIFRFFVRILSISFCFSRILFFPLILISILEEKNKYELIEERLNDENAFSSVFRNRIILLFHRFPSFLSLFISIALVFDASASQPCRQRGQKKKSGAAAQAPSQRASPTSSGESCLEEMSGTAFCRSSVAHYSAF